jgi:hypothetical protein
MEGLSIIGSYCMDTISANQTSIQRYLEKINGTRCSCPAKILEKLAPDDDARFYRLNLII